MRLSALLIVTGLLLAGLLSACNSAEHPPSAFVGDAPRKSTPAPIPPTDNARRVTVQEVQDLIARGEAVIIDVRNEASYDAGHIMGAKLIPYNEVQNHLAELPKDKLVVTYCS